jgi:flagella basal body P-ring formation protein FlgA
VIVQIASLILLASQAHAQANAKNSGDPERLSAIIQKSLSERISAAEIRLPSLGRLATQPALVELVELNGARVVEERPNGTAVIEINGKTAENETKSATIQTPFEAWKKVPVAIRRIYPNSKLKNEDFKVIEVNVATGLPREYRGVMVAPDTNFNQLQTKQTILENQYVVSTAVEKQPDLRKGDVVRLQLNSGDLTLSTQAVVEEPASVGDRVRVMTLKSKKEIVGKVSDDHSVEVSL